MISAGTAHSWAQLVADLCVLYKSSAFEKVCSLPSLPFEIQIYPQNLWKNFWKIFKGLVAGNVVHSYPKRFCISTTLWKLPGPDLQIVTISTIYLCIFVSFCKGFQTMSSMPHEKRSWTVAAAHVTTRKSHIQASRCAHCSCAFSAFVRLLAFCTAPKWHWHCVQYAGKAWSCYRDRF